MFLGNMSSFQVNFLIYDILEKKILSATLSGLEKPANSMFNRTSFLDTTIDKLVLKKNIKFLAESLLAFLFDYDIKV
jgi:hypothetical protein